jgi:hypothetical protein
MAPRKTPRKAGTKKAKQRKGPAHRARRSRPASTPHFVGREGSPVLDRYTPKSMDAAVGEIVASLPPPPKSAPSSTPRPAAASPAIPSPLAPPPLVPSSPASPPKPLISLERPFDVDDFSQLLGQTQIQVTVPRDSLAEVLRRACDFMGFGIYVYTIRVRPGPEELLKTFIVELQRVDYSPAVHDWAPFQDRGRADSPFGPTGTR